MVKMFKAKLERTSVPEIHHITLGGYQSAAVCAPPNLADHPGTTTPHKLFLASIGSCVNIIFEIACGKGRIKVLDLTSDITGTYETNGETHQRLFEIAVNSCPIGQCLEGSCVKLIENLEVIHR